MTGVAASVGSGAQQLVLSGPLIVAALVAAAAGALSFFSPCCLPLVPGYLSYVAGVAGSESPPRATTATDPAAESAPGLALTGPIAAEGVGGLASGGLRSGDRIGTGHRPRTGEIIGGTDERVRTQSAARSLRSRTMLGALLFVGGFAVVFTSYGALFGALGAALVANQMWLVRILGGFTILFGLMFSGLFWRLPLAGRTFRLAYRPRVGLVGAPVLGVLFGIGWTPCIGPTLAAVLTLATSSAGAGRGALLSFAYSLGLGLPFLFAALSLRTTMVRFAWPRRHARAVMRVGGLMLVVLGILQVSGAWTQMMSSLQGFISGWQPPL